MSQNRKNGNIKSFFKPKSEASRAPSRSRTPQPPAPSSSPTPASLRSTPAKPPPTRKLEIGASDDEEDASDGSDDSLADLSTLLGRARPAKTAPAPADKPRDPFATPRAKRTAGEFYSSPLAFLPKHQFDMKALAKDARQDDATHLSSLRIKAAQESEDDEPSLEKNEPLNDALVGIVGDNTGHDAQKVLRAVQRAEPGQSGLRYCFFKEDYKAPASTPAPRKASTGPWRLLTQGDVRTREQHLVSGLPHTILIKTGGLPDEVFQWILDELCVQKSLLVRQEYYNLIRQCPEQIERLITPGRLEDLLMRLGATDELKPLDSELTVSTQGDAYPGREWSYLQSFLILMGLVADHLSLPSVMYATQALLRMSLDRTILCSTDTLAEFEHTIQRLLAAIPQSSWASFCSETCAQLHACIQVQCIRTNALLCLPVSDKKAHELRRRLAIAFLFDDPALGRHHPEDIFTVRGAIDCLNDAAFTVGPKTDFAELRAGILLLDMAIDDGSFAPTGDREDEKAFNEEIDELALKLRSIWRKINDSGMKLARTEAKSVIEWVQQRLSHSVRTRRKAKASVFDIPGQREAQFLPQQQNFMSKFLKKQPQVPTSG